MENEVKKMIIPVAGMGTRFLPMSLAVPKEFLPLSDKPVIQYIVEEAKKSGITEIIFVIHPGQKLLTNYFKPSPELKETLVKRKKESALRDLSDFEDTFDGVKISFTTQKKPMGDGHAILQAGKLVGKNPVAVSFGDDVIDYEVPAIKQLIDVFQTCSAPVIGLKQLPKEKIPAYGNVAVEKIANGLYKIKKIIEKPDPSEISSNLVIVGKSILTSDVFTYLKKATPSKKGEIILAETLAKMLDEGKVIYGCELKGEWLECGDKMKWIKSFFHFALKDKKYRDELKQYLKITKI